MGLKLEGGKGEERVLVKRTISDQIRKLSTPFPVVASRAFLLRISWAAVFPCTLITMVHS